MGETGATQEQGPFDYKQGIKEFRARFRCGWRVAGCSAAAALMAGCSVAGALITWGAGPLEL